MAAGRGRRSRWRASRTPRRGVRSGDVPASASRRAGPAGSCRGWRSGCPACRSRPCRTPPRSSPRPSRCRRKGPRRGRAACRGLPSARSRRRSEPWPSEPVATSPAAYAGWGGLPARPSLRRVSISWSVIAGGLEHGVEERAGVALGKDQVVVGRAAGRTSRNVGTSQQHRHQVGGGHAGGGVPAAGGGGAADAVDAELLAASSRAALGVAHARHQLRRAWPRRRRTAAGTTWRTSPRPRARASRRRRRSRSRPRANASSVRRAPSTSSVERVARPRPWSWNASTVSRGIVLTVSGPISSST